MVQRANQLLPADTPGVLELLVKLYPNGKQSGHIHSLKVGDSLTLAPLKAFPWTPNKFERVALIAGGQGITPIYQLLKGILNNPVDKTAVTLVWGANKDEDVFFADEFAQLQERFPERFSVHYVVSNPAPGSAYSKGFITRELLEKAGLGASASANNNIKVFVSGPPPMEKAITGSKGWLGSVKGGVLSELGYTSAQIHRF